MENSPSIKTKIVMGLLAAIVLTAAFAFPIQAAAASCTTTYTVKSGDTAGAIAKAYNVTLTALINENNLKAPNYTIYLGQKLCIPGKSSGTQTSSTATATPSKTPTPSTDPVFKISIANNAVTVKGDDLTKGGIYAVRVMLGINRSAGTLQTVGVLRADQNGDAQKTYALPASYKDGKAFTVCVKDKFSNLTICKIIRTK